MLLSHYTTILRERNSELQIKVQDYGNGRTCLDVRRYTRYKTGELGPTRKGISLDFGDWQALLEIIHKHREKIEEMLDAA